MNSHSKSNRFYSLKSDLKERKHPKSTLKRPKKTFESYNYPNCKIQKPLQTDALKQTNTPSKNKKNHHIYKITPTKTEKSGKSGLKTITSTKNLRKITVKNPNPTKNLRKITVKNDHPNKKPQENYPGKRPQTVCVSVHLREAKVNPHDICNRISV